MYEAPTREVVGGEEVSGTEQPLSARLHRYHNSGEFYDTNSFSLSQMIVAAFRNMSDTFTEGFMNDFRTRFEGMMMELSFIEMIGN